MKPAARRAKMGDNMEPLIAALAGLGAAGLGGYLFWHFRNTRRKVWRRVADDLGLTFEKRHLLRATDRILGELDGVHVDVVGHSRGQNNNRQVYTKVVAQAPGLAELKLGHEGFGVGILKALGGEDHELGDAAFDASVRVRGDRDRALAVLGPEQRAAALALLDERRSASLADGEVQWTGTGVDGRYEELRSAIEEVAGAAGAFAGQPNLIEALEARLQTDPEPAVRATALRALHRSFPGERTDALITAALDDPDAVVAGAARGIRGLAHAGGLALEEALPGVGALAVAESPQGALSEAQQEAIRPAQPAGQQDKQKA